LMILMGSYGRCIIETTHQERAISGSSIVENEQLLANEQWTLDGSNLYKRS